MEGANFLRYLPVDSALNEWGWSLLDAGRQDILPAEPYPMPGHPRHYLFDKKGRRTLDEFQLVMVTTGTGWFESQEVEKKAIRAGEAFLLFPGHWHRYHPDPQTGWSERWLGFRGTEAERVMAHFFRPQDAVFTHFEATGLLRLLDQVIDMLRGSIAGREQILASHVPLALAHLRAPTITEQSAMTDEALVARVKEALAQDPMKRVDLLALAKTLGVSYSRLRFSFREQTGYSPREYENLCRLNRAGDLLRFGTDNVAEIAERLGFSSAFYFSRAFKKHYGVAPSQWKRQSIPRKGALLQAG